MKKMDENQMLILAASFPASKVIPKELTKSNVIISAAKIEEVADVLPFIKEWNTIHIKMGIN